MLIINICNAEKGSQFVHLIILSHIDFYGRHLKLNRDVRFGESGLNKLATSS